MVKLALIGAVLLSGHGHLTHHQRYWWPPQNNCTISTVDKNGVLRATPYIACTTTPAGWHSTPPNINPADIVDPAPGAENYCPYKPNGYCTPPS